MYKYLPIDTPQVHHHQKSLLTQSSSGGAHAELSSGRSASQVVANSLPASILILLDIYFSKHSVSFSQGFTSKDLLPIGIIASYAAATADTLSSELGILSETSPILITQPWRQVPKGTNGGVTSAGLLAGFFGGALISLVSLFLVPFSPSASKFMFFASITLAGFFGTVLDSLLGAVVQATVEDKSSGRVVEGENGKRVLVSEGGTRVQRGGVDWLNNNGVNFAMAAGTGVVAMGVAKLFGQ